MLVGPLEVDVWLLPFHPEDLYALIDQLASADKFHVLDLKALTALEVLSDGPGAGEILALEQADLLLRTLDLDLILSVRHSRAQVRVVWERQHDRVGGGAGFFGGDLVRHGEGAIDLTRDVLVRLVEPCACEEERGDFTTQVLKEDGVQEGQAPSDESCCAVVLLGLAGIPSSQAAPQETFEALWVYVALHRPALTDADLAGLLADRDRQSVSLF